MTNDDMHGFSSTVLLPKGEFYAGEPQGFTKLVCTGLGILSREEPEGVVKSSESPKLSTL